MSKFIKVDEADIQRRKYSNLRADWKEFMGMGIKVAKVDLTQYNYKSPIIAATVMARSVKYHAQPIDVVRRRDEVFLIRRDM